ncbi:MAG: NUDIX domain-containing protein [Chthonomonadales bacterium]|nr:NUDIX domain-containing protein [Chthonomonadales bacterium]
MSTSSQSATPSDRFYLCVKGVVTDGQGRALLLKRTADTAVDPGLWDLPGGKLDPGELFDDAFRREVREETGLDVEIVGVAGARDWVIPSRRVVYLILRASADSDDVCLSDEHVAFAWVRAEDLSDYAIAPQFLPLLEGAVGAKQ